MRAPQLVRETVYAFARYLLIVIGGVCAFMFLALAAGYLPFSDRPGPGWYGWFDGAAIEDLWASAPYIFGFATLAVWGALLYMMPFVVVVRLLARTRTRRSILAALGGLVSAIITFWVVCGAGWYIAIGLAPVVVGTGLGAVFGGLVLVGHTG